jgi:cell division initiation protein
MSELSALDILGKQFGKRMRGYAPFEVHEFLSQIASAMEALNRERGELKQQVHRLDQELAEFRERETALREALVSAQRSAESTIEAARVEGQQIVNEGQTLAERLVREAHERAQNIEVVISELRSRRREARADLMRLVELLEGVVRDDQKREQDERTTPQLAVLHGRTDTSSEHKA